MKEPSLKIVMKQIRRYNLGECDDVPCLDKFCKKLLLSRKQQGYARVPGPYYYLHEKEWAYRGRESNRDVVWAVKKKPGRKYNSNRKRRKEKHRVNRGWKMVREHGETFLAERIEKAKGERLKLLTDIQTAILKLRSAIAYG